MVRKIKSKLTIQEHKRLHPSGSCPGKFYGRAKLHKIDWKELVDEGLVDIKSTKDFMSKIKNKKVPNGYQIVSFDVKSLFTNVPLDRNIQLVLKRIYEKHEVSTNITKQEMKDMLILWTKKCSFHF